MGEAEAMTPGDILYTALAIGAFAIAAWLVLTDDFDHLAF